MSAFDAGAIRGSLELNTSAFTESLRESETVGGEFAASLGEMFTRLGMSPELAEMGEGIQHTLQAAFSGDWSKSILSAFHTVTIAGGSFADMVGDEAEDVRRLDLAAKSAGVSIKLLSELTAAGRDFNLGVDDFGMAFKFLEVRAGAAEAGNKDAIKGFRDIGVSVDDLKGKLKDPADLFNRLAEAVKGTEGQFQKQELVQQLLSRSGERMIPFLNEGSDAIKAMADQADRLGASFNDEDAKLADGFGKIKTTFDETWEGIKKKASEKILQDIIDNAPVIEADIVAIGNALTTIVIPALEKAAALTDKVVSWTDKAQSWYSKDQEGMFTKMFMSLDETHEGFMSPYLLKANILRHYEMETQGVTGDPKKVERDILQSLMKDEAGVGNAADMKYLADYPKAFHYLHRHDFQDRQAWLHPDADPTTQPSDGPTTRAASFQAASLQSMWADPTTRPTSFQAASLQSIGGDALNLFLKSVQSGVGSQNNDFAEAMNGTFAAHAAGPTTRPSSASPVNVGEVHIHLDARNVAESVSKALTPKIMAAMMQMKQSVHSSVKAAQMRDHL